MSLLSNDEEEATKSLKPPRKMKGALTAIYIMSTFIPKLSIEKSVTNRI